jgi:UDP-N-acetylmuramoyl-tripeptide--D-alanyl-D-alanine ligase
MTTDPLWTLDELALITRSTWEGTGGTATGFSIDTRTLKPGEVFVALQDQRDGHEFVFAAFQARASAALVRQRYVSGQNTGVLLRVEDPMRALVDIGCAARARLGADARIVAITGSAGKTGTKEMLRACLAPFGATHAPEKSFNNHFGVPLTLARMPAGTRYGVFEIGMNHAGEITPLVAMVQPHIVVITNVLPVHVGNFNEGLAGVATAKAEILSGALPGGVAVLPRDTVFYDQLAAKAVQRSLRVVSFGEHTDATVRATEIAEDETGSRVTLADGTMFRVGAPGRHLAINALAVVAVLAVLEAPLTTSLAPLAGFGAQAGRGQRSTLAWRGGGTVLLIDESYNANPASMRAALAAMTTLARGTHPRRIAVMGDMRELGPGGPAMHTDLADAVTGAGIDRVYACGPLMRGLYDRLPTALRGAHAQTSDDLVAALMADVRAGDAVMIKGSLGTNMAPLVKALTARALPAKT